MSRTDSPASVPPSSSTSSKEAEAAERERLVETLLRSEFDQDPSAQQEREEVRRALRSSTNALVHATVRDYGRVAVLGGAALGAAVGFVGALALITRRRTVPFTGRAFPLPEFTRSRTLCCIIRRCAHRRASFRCFARDHWGRWSWGLSRPQEIFGRSRCISFSTLPILLFIQWCLTGELTCADRGAG